MDPGHLLTAVASVTAGLSVLSLWWALPTAVAAFAAGRRPGRALPTVLVLVALLAAGLVAITVVPAWLDLSSVFVAVVVAAAMVPWFAGRFWRQYQDLVRAGWQRAGQLEREQRLVAEQARLRERARIAQDMHDVLGHDLSLIALSAGALQLSPDLAEPHRAAARDIRARAASAVERLGEVIGVLREEADGAPERAPDASLERLVAEA
ncbi:histidine kinase, partial [Streptomyces sp. HSW2009]|uniref:histidine kinase n=1 Tax=Streptomyces sp. HSW2009 TaxID=3142890 RepID=UPI0032EC999F